MKPSRRIIILAILLLAVGATALVVLLAPKGRSVAPDFVVTTVDNETFRLSEHSGETVVIQFFAPWCPTCESTAKSIDEVLPEWNGSAVRVLTISADPSVTPAELRAWRDTRNYTWPFALDTDNVAIKYEVYALGRVVIVDPGGRIVFSKEGTVSADEFRRAVEAPET